MAEAPTSPYEAFMTDPEAEAALLASENPQPVHNQKAALGIDEVAPGFVVLRKMADIQALTRSRDVLQFGGQGQGGMAGGGGLGLGGHHVAIPLELDGAEHTKWRKILDPVFAPKKMAPLEPRIRERSAALIDRFIDRHEVDAYEEWCEPLPSGVFLSIMGIPESELAHFLGFKNVILPSGAPGAPMPTLEERDAAFTDCETWFAAEFDRREKSGNYGEDVIGWLMQVDVDGRRITRDELHGICNLLMIAGLDTVAASLACILAHLARHPDRRRTILANPDIWPSAIEEIFRFESPVTQGYRHATKDIELPSGTMKAGTNAVLWWSAANVDGEAFDDPLEVRLDRQPNPHIGFASGWHRCLGSHLARMELRAALDVWHSRIPDYDIPEGVELRYSANPRAPHTLPLTW